MTNCEQGGWYTNVWRGWAANNSCTDLHPVVPENFKRVIVQPLFKLTPALRSLHLDAKKGRDVVLTVDLRVNRNNTSPTGSPFGTSDVRRRAVHARMLRCDDGVCSPVVEGTSQEVCGQGSRRRVGARGNRLEMVDEHGIVSRRKLHPVDVAGCEGKLVTQWTERQRMLCLVPGLNTGDAA